MVQYLRITHAYGMNMPYITNDVMKPFIIC